LTYYNFDIHDPIAIISAEVLLGKREIRWCFVSPPHLSSASSLPCKRGNPEDSALVLYARNTVQLLDRSRLPFSCTMPPPPKKNGPKLNAFITGFMESYSSVNMSHESKRLKKSRSDWLNSGNALIQRVKM